MTYDAARAPAMVPITADTATMPAGKLKQKR